MTGRSGHQPPDRARDQHGREVDDADVERRRQRGAGEPAEEQRRASDRPHHERLEEAAVGIPSHGPERQKDREDRAEEEGREHREAEDGRAGEGLAVDAGLRRLERKVLRLLEGPIGAERVESEKARREDEDDHEDPPAQRLTKRVAGDDRKRAHPLSPPTRSR